MKTRVHVDAVNRFARDDGSSRLVIDGRTKNGDGVRFTFENCDADPRSFMGAQLEIDDAETLLAQYREARIPVSALAQERLGTLGRRVPSSGFARRRARHPEGTMTATVEVGMKLYSSCRAEVVGEITRVGEDQCGAKVIDLLVPDINEYLHYEDDVENGFDNECTRIVPAGPVTFVDLQYVLRPYDPMPDGSPWTIVVVHTPMGGCYRCTSGFRLLGANGEGV